MTNQKLDELAKLAMEVSVMVRSFMEKRTSDEDQPLRLELLDFYKTLGALVLNASFFSQRIPPSGDDVQ